MVSSKYDAFRWRLFEKTGCLLTVDGSEDHLVTPEGLTNYTCPAPTQLPPSNNDPRSNRSESVEEDDSVEIEEVPIIDEFENDEEVELFEASEQIDDGNVFDFFNMV